MGCAAATILNPFGVGLWFGVAHSVGDPLIRQVIADWVPLSTMLLSVWRTSPSELLAYIPQLLLFAGFVVAVAMAPDLDDAAMLAVATIFIGAAFYAARNVAVAVIALAIPLARHASLALERRAEGKAGAPADNDEPPARMIAICAIAVALVGGTFSNRLKTWKPVPTGALAFMQEHKLHGNILPQFEWGSYVLWHMGDAFKVYIDPRGELVYTDKQEGDYAKFYYGMDGADKLLEAYPHDYVLMGVHTKGADIVRKDARWRLIYQDGTAALFAKASDHREIATAGTIAVSDSKPADTYFP
jgi:hypothetical protein